MLSLLPSSNTKKNDIDQILLQAFNYLKGNVSQTFESSSCKKRFPKCVCYWYNVLWWMSFIPCDNWKTLLFLHKFIVNQSLFATAIFLRSLKTVFWKRSVFYFYYSHNNVVILLITKVLNKTSTSNISLTICLLITFFCILSFCESKDGESVPQFYLLMQFKSLEAWFKDIINPSQLLIFTNVIRCSTVPLWVGYFIYFKFKRVSSILYQSLHP